MGNSAASLPYTLGKPICEKVEGWDWLEGTQKSDQQRVSVFVAKKPSLANHLECARHHYGHCKKLRHPYILQVLATLDTDHPDEKSASSSKETGDWMIVTEECMPLHVWLQTNPPPEQIAWGIECIIRALHFLHASANMAHGHLSPQSIVATPAGDLKLWNFALLTELPVSPHFQRQQKVTPHSYQTPERLANDFTTINSTGVHAMDSFALGVLIGHLYQQNIPPLLVKAVQRLQTPKAKMRPRLQPLLKCPVFDTPYQKLQLQLEEFNVKPSEEKTAFWNTVKPQLQAQLIPANLARYKLLPLLKLSIQTICTNDALKAQDGFRKEVASMLPALFWIGREFEDFGPLASSIALLFTVNDRGIRGALLQRAQILSEYLDAKDLNQSVFEPLCSGFADSSAALRELTLQATDHLVPHLTAPNLEKLSRYLVRLQSDTEASIRTRTIIFFRPLVPQLAPTTRSKMLLPALIRALKDSSMQCRLEALQTTVDCKEFFDVDGMAKQVLPAVIPSLLDPSQQVRKRAFGVVDDFLFGLRQLSEGMGDVADEFVASAPVKSTGRAVSAPKSAAQPQAPPAASSSGGYFSGWMSSKTTAATAAPAAAQPRSAPQPVAAPPRPTPVVPSVSPMKLNDDDGWGDDDLDLGEPKGSLFAPAKEENVFGSFGNNKSNTSAAPKPTVTKLAVDDDMDGWDDF